MRWHPNPIARLEFEIDDQVKLASGGPRPWTVRACSEHFAVLVRQAPFELRGVLEYTVLDWRNGVRGPCNLIGHGYGDGTYNSEECANMLLDFEYETEQDPAYIEAMERGEKSWFPERDKLEISHRNWAPIDIVSVNGEPVQLRAG